jgi:uncharacterized protein YndB with AHSA1/START domain
VAREYVFVDEWDVDAPQEVVFDALADARTYPAWWTPVYTSVEGRVSRASARRRAISSRGSCRTRSR